MVRNSVKKMAYTINTSQVRPYSTYRLDRGFLFKRAGTQVPVVPQFKGVQIVTQTIAATAANPHTVTQTALTSFQIPTVPVAIQWKLR